jgi:hypothetical protein
MIMTELGGGEVASLIEGDGERRAVDVRPGDIIAPRLIRDFCACVMRRRWVYQ